MAPEMLTITTNPNVTKWSLENGYKDKRHEKSYPIRVFNSAQGAGLFSFLQLFDKDIEYFCQGTLQGFRVFLHAPGQTFKFSRHFRVSVLEEAEVLIKPKLITTSKELRGYAPNQRQCFYQSERKLRFFKIFGQNNCDAECLSNFTVFKCGCVQFSMPSKKIPIN